MTAVDFWHYLVATIIAMLPGNLIFCHLGAIGERALTGEGRTHPLEMLALGLGIASMITVTVWITRILRQHGEEPQSKVPGEPVVKR